MSMNLNQRKPKVNCWDCDWMSKAYQWCAMLGKTLQADEFRDSEDCEYFIKYPRKRGKQ